MLALTNYTREELESHFDRQGIEKFRARQVLQWVYGKKACSFPAMTDLPSTLRDQLAHEWVLTRMALHQSFHSRDGSKKLLFHCEDKKIIESVLIPEFWERSPLSKPYPKQETGYTQCVSTQVGCPIGCVFCASGKEGLLRHLEASEIISQILLAERYLRDEKSKIPQPKSPEIQELEVGSRQIEKKGQKTGVGNSQPLVSRRIGNLVIMGMGEPLANFNALTQALRIVTASWGLGIGLHRITLSTIGLLDKLRELMDLKLTPNLAVSLHSAIPEKRATLIPVHFPYTLTELVDFVVAYREKTQKSVTFEHVLLSGINDQSDDAEALGKLAGEKGIKVNLIPYNPVEGFSWKRSSPKDIFAFAKIVRRYNVWITTRKTWGVDISAACGQLALKEEVKE